jgi:hypothetical protein
MKLLVLMLVATMMASCGSTDVSATTEATATGIAIPTSEPTPKAIPSPTIDERTAYQDAVCDVIDPLVMAVGRQMAPALEALNDGDAQAAARERTRLDVLIEDMLAALEAGPDYSEARTMETRLEASVTAFQDGLDAFGDGSYGEATGLFEVSSELFDEAVTEFGRIC